MRRRPTYDPEAYAAELEARCRRSVSAWSPRGGKRQQRLPPADEQRRQEALRLLDPDRDDDGEAA